MRRKSLLLTVAVTLLSAAGLSAQATISARAATIRIGGRLHTQYYSSSVDAFPDHFLFRRARIIADITVSDFFDARIQPDFAGASTELKDAYVRFKFAPSFELTMGQFKRAFDLFELSSSTDLSIIERDGRVGVLNECKGVLSNCSYSRLTEKLQFSDRDTGFRAAGTGGRLSYEVSLTNGTGTALIDVNKAKSVSGRLSVDVAEGLTVSGQYARHDYVTSGDRETTEYADAWGADLQYGTWRDGLLFQAAVVSGDNWRNRDDNGVPSGFTAFQAVASYYHAMESARWAGLEPLFRLSYADPDTDAASDGGLVLTPGLMLYVLGKNKVGFNVDVWKPQSGDTQYSFKLQSFLYF